MNFVQKIEDIHRKKVLPVMASLLVLFFSVPASAQQIGTSGWSPSAQNRASIASMIYQVENASSGAASNTATASGEGVTQLVCGGGDEGAARGNSTCIILNNSMGNVALDQLSEGNQTASSNEEVSINEGPDENSVDEVLDALNGDS